MYSSGLCSVKPAADHVGQVHRGIPVPCRWLPDVLFRVEDVAVAAEGLEVGFLEPQRFVRAFVSGAVVKPSDSETPRRYWADGDRGRN